MRRRREKKDAPQKCGRRSIEAVLKRMEKGQTVSGIAEELKLEPAFVEEICRIKVTHPGVTALGILDKMEVNKNRKMKQQSYEQTVKREGNTMT